MRMNFQVDSPAAWAAEYHNCTLLKRNVSVEKHLFESADATCQLLRSCSEEALSNLCKLITENGLGGRKVYLPAKGKSERVPALLPPQGVLKVLACLKDVGHDACTMPTAWHHDGRDMLHLQKHSAKVPVKFVVAQLEAMEETKALAWLQAMDITSESQGSGDSDSGGSDSSDSDWADYSDPGDSGDSDSGDSDSGDSDWADYSDPGDSGDSDSGDSDWADYSDPGDSGDSDSGDSDSGGSEALFDQELAKTALEVGQITALPKVLRILGLWKLGMPQILLDALVASHRLELMQLMELPPEHSLSDAFSGVKVLDASLDDASDLCFVSLALNLAQNLKELHVSCFKCNDFAKVPSAKAWNHLSSQIAKIQHLRLDHFIVTDPGLVVHQAKSLKSLDLWHNQIYTLPKEVFSGLSNLETLYLNFNELTTIRKEAFSGLSKLTILSLSHNDLTELPKEVFSGLSNLKKLQLGHNDLTELPKKVFSGLSRLRYLYLAQNHLKEDDIRGLSNLRARGVRILY